jgi:hypothetical protein
MACRGNEDKTCFIDNDTSVGVSIQFQTPISLKHDDHVPRSQLFSHV